jgi:tetratricopeptide (TPR) repeat protein
MPLVSADLTQIEWETPREAVRVADAVRLIQLLGFKEGAHPTLSVGDADLLHTFLRNARRSTPGPSEERDALAAMYRYLSTSEWMPPHLATEYRLRASLLEGPRGESPGEAVRAEKPIAEVPPHPPLLPEMDFDLEEDDLTLPAPNPFRPEPTPEPSPEPEPPLPLPDPMPGPGPEPQPEPEPVPEEGRVDTAKWTEFEAMQHGLDRERAELEASARSQSEQLRSKETSLEERERLLKSKEQDIEAQARATTERLVTLEKDEARRGVLQFLGTIPGMSEAHADVIATAFPDMKSLQAADVKALTQCQGVTEALARSIRYELVPGEVDEEQHATLLQEEAQTFLAEGDYDAALECYDRLLRDRPEEIGLWFDRAEVLVLLHRTEEALQCYRRVLDADRNHRRAWFERANLLFGLGRIPDAIEALREVLRIEPSKAGDIVLKAEQLRRDGHPNEAAMLFQAILDANPAETRSLLGLGDTLLDLGDTDGAEALFTRALGKNPQNPPILFRRGELLERKGRWGAAIQYYNRAIALQWNFVNPWLGKAQILLNQGRVPEALECFDKVLSFDSKNMEAWAGKARAHAALGDSEAAASALTKASKADPESRLLQAARKAIEAMPAAAAEPEEPPETPESPIDFPALVKAFEEIEEEPAEKPPSPPEDARAPPDFQTFIESIEPDEEEVHVLVQLAELALEGGDATMALLRYEQALQREERNPDAWTGKGVALQQLERYREALDAYDRALALKPDHKLAAKWRATCLRHLEAEGSE